MIKLIGITGKARTGKDTVCDIIVDRIPCAVRYAMADPIKRSFFSMVEANTAAERIQLMEDKEKVIEGLGHSPRAILQELGGTLRERLGEDFWVYFLDMFVKEIQEVEDSFTKGEDMCPIFVVVPDVRYDNEARYIKEVHNGLIFKTIRDDAPEVREHSSENGISEKYIDFVIENNGTLQDLEDKVKQLLKEGELDGYR